MINFYQVHKLYIWILLSITLTPYFIFYNHNFQQLILFNTLQALFILSTLFLLTLVATYIFEKIFPKFITLFFIFLIMSVGAALNFEFLYTNLIVEGISQLIVSINAKLIFVLIYFLSIIVVIALVRFEIFKVFFLFFFLSGLFLPISQLIFKAINDRPTEIRNVEVNLKNHSTKKIYTSGENVYFILLDGYASEKTFNRMSYNNSDFYNYLYKKEFIRLGENSSYNLTYMALASIFNLTYPVIEGDPRYTNRSSFYPNILSHENAPLLIQQLGNLGYEFIFSGNSWSGCDPRHMSCLKHLSYRFLNRESSVLFSKTFFGRYLYLIVDHDYDAMSILFDNFANIVNEETSEFYFLHHFSPHPPYLSDDCKTPLGMSLIAWEPVENYLKTVECVNKKTMKLISTISANDPSGIIVIQSDHGPMTRMHWLNDIDQSKDVHLKNRIGIINFIKAPKACHKWLRSNIGPINTVRFVLGCISRKEPEYIEDKTYIGVYEGEDFGTVKEYILN